MKSFRSKIGHYPEEIPIHFVQYSEIISAVKPFFNISRLFGVPSFSVIENVISRGGAFTFFGFLSAFLLINQLFLLIVKLVKGEDFVRKSGPEIIIRIHVICVHIWSLVYSSKLGSAIRNSPLVENRINKVYNGADGEFIPPWILRRKCILWTILYIIISLGLTLKTFVVNTLFGEMKSISEIWDTYGLDSCGLEPKMFFHSSITSGYCLIMEFATNFVWIFAEILLLILSLIMSEMFRRINSKGIQRIEPTKLSSIEIDLVREHHGLTSKLVKEFDDGIATLNLINVVFNIAFLVVAIYSVITLRNRDRILMASNILKLYCKIIVAACKLIAGLVAASILHHRAHEAISEIRSWPMAREFSDFSINNGRASVIHAFLAQLSYPSIGFTIGKFVAITGKLLGLIALGIGVFFAFARITISSCSRGGSSRTT